MGLGAGRKEARSAPWGATAPAGRAGKPATTVNSARRGAAAARTGKPAAPSGNAGRRGAASGNARRWDGAGTTPVRKRPGLGEKGATVARRLVSGEGLRGTGRPRSTGAGTGRTRSPGVAEGRPRSTGAWEGRPRSTGAGNGRARSPGAAEGRPRSTGAGNGRARFPGAADGRPRSSGRWEGRPAGAGGPRDALAGRRNAAPGARSRAGYERSEVIRGAPRAREAPPGARPRDPITWRESCPVGCAARRPFEGLAPPATRRARPLLARVSPVACARRVRREARRQGLALYVGLTLRQPSALRIALAPRPSHDPYAPTGGASPGTGRTRSLARTSPSWRAQRRSGVAQVVS